jgi:uncharacterized protein
MILNIRVMPKAGRNLVKVENGALKVYLTSPAQEGQANSQLIQVLSEHLKVKKYHIKIIKGLKSRDKIVEINA